ncbi:uncharacterized protein BDR25DRAFT_350975 [Lindgomyces ingoldianus]|uniref:Uncharacterized protein n=1 Tax=Lindgomyces ingoldianus TaxID=673940 RepID=A0ACB6R8U6_9PLEO|nr:uncharacterized protein BDR25DRAFT_350975 [Lindgomyces ingoldianus]KAF2475606.1 hypothetical protein BDR25DRAFT_350975 [Lindgomyces ingoldianus]
MAASSALQPWAFDVSSLMVLIGEDEERTYRLSRRSLSQCLVAVPVVGLQNYVRSYDLLLEPTSFTYFSPYGVKSAPLRNAQLSNAIKNGRLLEDQRYTVFSIPPNSESKEGRGKTNKKWELVLHLWAATTWALFGGLLVGTVLIPGMTWISIATCTVYTGWSIVLRLTEYFNVRPAPVPRNVVTNPDLPEAVFIMGRNNSALVLEGNRKDVKDWTSRGLVYSDQPLGIPSWMWQAFTRLGSLLVLLFIFSAIPNGSTVDQVGFILLNSLAQANVLVGQWLNGEYSLSKLQKVEDTRLQTRTHIYANLIRRFKDAEQRFSWIDVSGLLPKTSAWEKWSVEVVCEENKDPKTLYKEIVRSIDGSSTEETDPDATVIKGDQRIHSPAPVSKSRARIRGKIFNGPVSLQEETS